ncbi:hypothetical protein EJB05_20425 [Eragrostis curvula]|uniref:Uncharacterized protein n=1 Tax=Eragrostis curvula TaxID=38414 RepID=A0A5J9V0A3_9POAL|nr:hypothetical protein EJB05_20425 [Eragrostis curvula]
MPRFSILGRLAPNRDIMWTGFVSSLAKLQEGMRNTMREKEEGQGPYMTVGLIRTAIGVGMITMRYHFIFQESSCWSSSSSIPRHCVQNLFNPCCFVVAPEILHMQKFFFFSFVVHNELTTTSALFSGLVNGRVRACYFGHE